MLTATLSISNCFQIFFAITNYHPKTGTPICSAQGFLSQFFNVAVIVWTLMLAITLDLVVVRKRNPLPFWVSNFIVWTIAGDFLFQMIVLSYLRFTCARLQGLMHRYHFPRISMVETERLVELSPILSTPLEASI